MACCYVLLASSAVSVKYVICDDNDFRLMFSFFYYYLQFDFSGKSNHSVPFIFFSCVRWNSPKF